MEPPLKSPKYSDWRESGLVSIWSRWENSEPRWDMEAPCPFPHTLPCTSLLSACSSVSLTISFNKLVNVSVSLSFGICSRKIIQPKERGYWTLQAIASGSETQVAIWACNWHSDTTSGSVRSELNVSISSWCCKELLVVEEKHVGGQTCHNWNVLCEHGRGVRVKRAHRRETYSKKELGFSRTHGKLFSLCAGEASINIQTQDSLFCLPSLLSFQSLPLCSLNNQFPGGSVVKNSPAMQEPQVGSLGWHDPLEEGMATHFSILAWRILWTEEPSRLQSIGLQRVRHDWSDLACITICW